MYDCCIVDVVGCKLNLKGVDCVLGIVNGVDDCFGVELFFGFDKVFVILVVC